MRSQLLQVSMCILHLYTQISFILHRNKISDYRITIFGTVTMKIKCSFSIRFVFKSQTQYSLQLRRSSKTSIISKRGQNTLTHTECGLDNCNMTPRHVRNIYIYIYIYIYFATTSRLTKPPIQLVSGAVSLGIKRPGHEAGHSRSSSV